MVDSKKYQEKLNKRYPQEKLKVLEYHGARQYTRIQCLTCGKIFEYQAGGAALVKSKSALCHNCMNKIKKKNIFQKKMSCFTQDNLSVLSFSSLSEPCIIKCNNCSTTFQFKQAKYALNKTRDFFCPVCFPAKEEQMEQTRQKFILWLQKNNDWILAQDISKIHSDDTVDCTCLHCGRVNKKTIYDYMRGRRCFCQTTTEPKTTKQFEEELDSDYFLLSEYHGANSKVILRHESCGFIYDVTPHNYLCGKRCPRCARKESKGEKYIRDFLDKNHISYIKEYPVDIDGHKLRFDFYLPAENIYLEYQGEQHFRPIDFFGGELRFKKQVFYDNLKRQFAKNNLYTISYFQDIDLELTNILHSSTTILKQE